MVVKLDLQNYDATQNNHLSEQK